MEKKDLSKPTPVTTESIQLTEVKELQKAIDKEYRTDHLTLPIVVPVQDPERDRISAIEREAILNPDGDADKIVVDDKGTTLRELREQYQYGIMPKDAPKEAIASIGKHKIELVDNGTTVVITPPNKEESEVVIKAPETNAPENVPSGSELMTKTTPVIETLNEPVKEDKKEDKKSDDKKSNE